MTLPYDREKESADILRDLIQLRIRLDRLARNLDYPMYEMERAQSFIGLAVTSVSTLRPGPQRKEGIKP